MSKKIFSFNLDFRSNFGIFKLKAKTPSGRNMNYD